MKYLNAFNDEWRADNASAPKFARAVGKTIAALKLEDNESALRIGLADGSEIRLVDDGQSCCEHRYMTTDDKLEDFVGAKLLDVEIKDGPSTTGEYDDEHEVQFLEVTTDRGSFVMSTHNEHNGYYGGFNIVAQEA